MIVKRDALSSFLFPWLTLFNFRIEPCKIYYYLIWSPFILLVTVIISFLADPSFSQLQRGKKKKSKEEEVKIRSPHCDCHCLNPKILFSALSYYKCTYKTQTLTHSLLNPLSAITAWRDNIQFASLLWGDQYSSFLTSFVFVFIIVISFIIIFWVYVIIFGVGLDQISFVKVQFFLILFYS